MHEFRERFNARKSRTKRKLLREIERENKLKKKKEEFEDKKLTRKIREEQKRIKAELKVFKQEEKEQRRIDRAERNRKIKAGFNRLVEANVRLPSIRRRRTKPVIDESGVA